MLLGNEQPVALHGTAARRLNTRTRSRPPPRGLAHRALRPVLQVVGAVFGMLRAGWRGELPLWLAVPAFIGTCWAVSPIFSKLYMLIPAWRMADPLVLSAWLACLLAVLLWSAVGVWRCARSNQEHGGPTVLAVGALALMLPVGAQSLATARDVSCVAGGAWREAWPTRPASSPGPINPFFSRAVMSYDAPSQTLWITGGIERGTAEDFAAALKQHPQTKTIGLISPGGYVDEMQAMSERIREGRFDTFAPARCASACVSLFAAGQQRWVTQESRFGLHRSGHECFEDTGPSAEDLQDAAALREAGVSEAFIQRALDTPFQSIWRPALGDVLASGLATGVREGAPKP